ncbi:MAG: insulinase family protein [Muribaculaceae bacterium]|nr:insulinase family protein [Muribaculaceae bacterium]
MLNMDHSKTEIETLSNGLRVVCSQRPGITYCGIVVNAGTRDEQTLTADDNTPSHKDEAGLAHFVEHTIFKGTNKRRSHHISSRMESIGGELNAYTTKEETVIYTTAPSGYTERAIELLADLIINSNFPDHELEREKEVVIDEINSYLDNPAEAIFDEFEDLMYAGSPLGHNILGTPQSVKGLTGADCRAFIEHNYTPENMVLYCVGEMPPTKVYQLAEKYFGSLDRPLTTRRNRLLYPKEHSSFDEIRDFGLHQSHTLMGARVFGRMDSRRHALLFMNNYLGGPAMNSVLNREMRDKRGYVYTVESMIAMLSDCGLFEVYFGCDPEHTPKCKRLVLRELQKLAETPMKPRVFDAAIRQYLGQLEVASAYAESQAMSLGKSVMYFGKVLTIADTRSRLKEMTPSDVQQIATLICDKGLSSLTLK